MNAFTMEILNDILKEGCSLRDYISHMRYELKLFQEARSRLSFNDRNLSRFKINGIEYALYIERDKLSISSADDRESWFRLDLKRPTLRQKTNIILLIHKINKGYCQIDDERHFREFLLDSLSCGENMTFLASDAEHQEVEPFEVLQLIRNCVS